VGRSPAVRRSPPAAATSGFAAALRRTLQHVADTLPDPRVAETLEQQAGRAYGLAADADPSRFYVPRAVDQMLMDMYRRNKNRRRAEGSTVESSRRGFDPPPSPRSRPGLPIGPPSVAPHVARGQEVQTP